MANDSGGGIGVLGVLIGALIVIVVGGGILAANGTFSKSGAPTAKIEMPKISTTGSK